MTTHIEKLENLKKEHDPFYASVTAQNQSPAEQSPLCNQRVSRMPYYYVFVNMNLKVRIPFEGVEAESEDEAKQLVLGGHVSIGELGGEVCCEEVWRQLDCGLVELTDMEVEEDTGSD